MPPETVFTFNITFGVLLIGICVFFFSLLAVIWKGKSEIADTVKKEIAPLQRTNLCVVGAITEIQTIIQQKYKGLLLNHKLVESSGSPLNPTEYGASLIKESGLEKILDDNKELLCTKLKASLPQDYTEYDVQEHARNLLVSLQDDPIMKPVKNWIYNNPIDIEIILRVGGLWLRSDFLNQPRKTNINEQDKTEQ